MEVKTIDVQKTQTKLADLVSWIAMGTEIILTAGNKPIARIVPVESKSSKKRIPDLHPNSVWMSDDFNAPLPDSFWLGKDDDES